MGNPLKDLSKMFQGKQEKTYIGTVVNVTATYTEVRTDSGLSMRVYGSASEGDRVVVKGSQILSKIGDSTIPTVQIY